MDKKKYTVAIDVPEGYKLIDKGNNHYEVVKKEQLLPKTWKEFCYTHSIWKGEIYIAPDSLLLTTTNRERDVETDRNLLPNKETAEAILALMQLIQLRDYYNDGWKPDWANYKSHKYVIYNDMDKVKTSVNTTTSHVLSFKSNELATEFLNNFGDLIEIAKPLI